jgi:hypothetical protein
LTVIGSILRRAGSVAGADLEHEIVLPAPRIRFANARTPDQLRENAGGLQWCRPKAKGIKVEKLPSMLGPDGAEPAVSQTSSKSPARTSKAKCVRTPGVSAAWKTFHQLRTGANFRPQSWADAGPGVPDTIGVPLPAGTSP